MEQRMTPLVDPGILEKLMPFTPDTSPRSAIEDRMTGSLRSLDGRTIGRCETGFFRWCLFDVCTGGLCIFGTK